jgi:hypothetical protein
LTRRSVHSTAIVRTETEAATQRKLTWQWIKKKQGRIEFQFL